MNWDWVKDLPVWQKLLSALGVVSTAAYSRIRSNSKLWLEFNESRKSYVSSYEDFGDDDGRIHRKHVRLILHNDGMKAVRGCQVFLERIEEVTVDGLKPLNYPTPLRLLWSKEGSGRNEDARTISKGGDIVDLFRTDHIDAGDRILLYDIESTQILHFKKRYRFTIITRAEDVSACELLLDVFFGSSWDSIQVLEPKSVVVRSRKKHK